MSPDVNKYDFPLAVTHDCPKPTLPFSMIVSPRPNWTCGVCGRVYFHEIPGCGGGGWWVEIQGPSR